uniref:Glycosyl transferase family 8 protein n=1 Tax=Phaffia rhodozyma TaxID=264483 RepID=A0A1C9U6A8_PHARH|nr:glycosyl transferase family 8 protein [Phaffia rhodozyma]
MTVVTATAPFAPPVNGAWVALCTKSSYLQGLLVLNHSLRSTSPPTAYPLVAMITAPFPPEAREVCRRAGILLKEVDSLRPTEGTHELNEHDLRFMDTWTKFRAFEWTEYERIITLDCDMLVQKNMDDLFTLPLPGPDWVAGTHVCACNPRRLSHYPNDWIPENCAYTAQHLPSALTHPPLKIQPDGPRPHGLINGGLIVLTPSKTVFKDIVTFLRTSPLIKTFSFADQDLYAAFFKNHWQPVPYVYNALKTLRVIHPDIWSDSDVRNIHYILDKPWQHPQGSPSKASADRSTAFLHGLWWLAYEDMLSQMKLDPESGWDVVDEWVAK